jgi:hypothetical protein
MDQYTVTFRGWKAIAVIALIVAVYGLRVYSRIQKVDEDGRNVLQAWLLKDYNGQGPRDIMRRMQDYKAGLPVQPMKAIEPMNIDFPVLSAHGSASEMVVKVEISVDGSPPPDGQPIRYFHMSHDADRGWSVSSETDSFWYYRTMLR